MEGAGPMMPETKPTEIRAMSNPLLGVSELGELGLRYAGPGAELAPMTGAGD